jgi:hypothetical protein
VLKKKCVTGGLVIAAATAGTLLTGSTASAQSMGGWGHFGHHFRSFSGKNHWNGNENTAWNRIRIRIHNRNNNVAFARNEQQQRQRQWQRQLLQQGRNSVTAAECTAGGGIVGGLSPQRCIGGTFDGLLVVG